MSRRDWSDDDFKQSLRKILANHHKKQLVHKEQIEAFINLWTYHQGRFDVLSEYKELSTKLGFLMISGMSVAINFFILPLLLNFMKLF